MVGSSSMRSRARLDETPHPRGSADKPRRSAPRTTDERKGAAPNELSPVSRGGPHKMPSRLKARRANRPATCTITPGWFCTKSSSTRGCADFHDFAAFLRVGQSRGAGYETKNPAGFAPTGSRFSVVNSLRARSHQPAVLLRRRIFTVHAPQLMTCLR